MTEYDVERDSTYAPMGPFLVECGYAQALSAELNISPVESAGFISMLASLEISLSKSETIDHITNGGIEAACYWTGKRGALVSAFEKTGILVGEHENPDNPRAIARPLHDALVKKAIDTREGNRKRKAEQRARERERERTNAVLSEARTVLDNVTRDSHV